MFNKKEFFNRFYNQCIDATGEKIGFNILEHDKFHRVLKKVEDYYSKEMFADKENFNREYNVDTLLYDMFNKNSKAKNNNLNFFILIITIFIIMNSTLLVSFVTMCIAVLIYSFLIYTKTKEENCLSYIYMTLQIRKEILKKNNE